MAFEINLISLFFQASLVVKLVLITLLLISFVSWWFIIEKYITFKRAERDIYEFNKIFWTNNDLEKIFTKLQRKEKLIGLEQVFVSGFKEFSKKEKKPPNLDQIKKILEITISRCEEEFSKRLPFLSTAASVSPYIGLFGTVWGIMNAFGGLSQLTQVSITVVAPGISEALIATALGLFAAIPALVSYNWNLNKINSFVNEYSNFSEELIIFFLTKLMRAKNPKKYLAEINVIPYVDIMLVLLLIFMVTAPFIIQGINVDLPKVDSAPIDDFENNSLTISINSSGKYYLELDTFKDQELTLEKIENELKKIITSNKVEVFIRADSQVIFDDVAKLMSSLQKLKPNSINFLTEPKND